MQVEAEGQPADKADGADDEGEQAFTKVGGRNARPPKGSPAAKAAAEQKEREEFQRCIEETKDERRERAKQKEQKAAAAAKKKEEQEIKEEVDALNGENRR